MNNQVTTTIAEYFELPSQGKIYRTEINPNVKLRSMNMIDEMKRLSPSDRPYQNLCGVIDDCILEGPEMSTYDMCLGDYQYLLYKLRTVTYGDMYKGQAVCPYCNEKNHTEFSLDNLYIKKYSQDVEKYRTIELPSSGKVVKIKMRTPRILDTTAQKIRDFKQKNASLNSTLLYSVESIIEEVDGNLADPVFTQEWIKTLNMQDINIITQYSEKLDSCIGVDNRLFYTCDTCGLGFISSLKTDNEFFRPTLDI